MVTQASMETGEWRMKGEDSEWRDLGRTSDLYYSQETECSPSYVSDTTYSLTYNI